MCSTVAGVGSDKPSHLALSDTRIALVFRSADEGVFSCSGTDVAVLQQGFLGVDVDKHSAKSDNTSLIQMRRLGASLLTPPLGVCLSLKQGCQIR